MADPIETFLSANLPDKITVKDGTQAPPDGVALVLVRGGAATPADRRLDGIGHQRRTAWRLVCVNNTRAGAAKIAALVTDLLDGALVGGQFFAVSFVSDPLEDRNDPSQWRWSCTVEAVAQTPRRSHG